MSPRADKLIEKGAILLRRTLSLMAHLGRV
jgi:hypothetical protein